MCSKKNGEREVSLSATQKIRDLLLLPRDIRECPEIVSSIRECIEQDDKALEYYVQWMRFEATLHRTLSHEADPPAVIVSEIQRRSRRLQLMRGTIVTAACLIAFCLVISSIQMSASRLSRQAEQPILAARIEADGKIVWSNEVPKQSRSAASGEWISFREGTLKVHMACGAELALQGPVTLQFIDGWEVKLRQGKVCAFVSPPARGFRVKSGELTVTDLGTIFGVIASSDGFTDVHVIQGVITAESPSAQKSMIHAGVAHQYEPAGRLAKTGPSNASLFDDQLRALTGIGQISGSLEFLYIAPPSLAAEALPPHKGACIFLERKDSSVIAPLSLYAATAGSWTEQSNPELIEIPAGTRVSTYLIHTEVSPVWPVQASVRFEGEILGLALSEPQLQETDPIYGHPSVTYPAPTAKGTRGAVIKEGDDEIRVSDDRRTLEIKINHSGKALDQIRVFVVEN